MPLGQQENSCPQGRKAASSWTFKLTYWQFVVICSEGTLCARSLCQKAALYLARMLINVLHSVLAGLALRQSVICHADTVGVRLFVLSFGFASSFLLILSCRLSCSFEALLCLPVAAGYHRERANQTGRQAREQGRLSE